MKHTLFIKQLAEYFDIYLPLNKKCSKNTITAYADGFVTLFQFFQEEKGKGHYRIEYEDMTMQVIDEFVLWMQNRKNYSAASQKQRISVLSSFLKYASRREMDALGAYNAVAQAQTPKIPRECFPYFTLEEIKTLLHVPKYTGKSGYRDITLLSLLYDSGARAQELCDILIGDMTITETSSIRLHGKGHKTREIPISSNVASLIKNYLKERGKNSKDNRAEHLFPSQRSDRITPACIRNLVRKYVIDANQKRVDLFNETGYSPHSFRRSRAVHMLEAGIPLIYIRNFLGHESIQTTEIYLRVNQRSVGKILQERDIENPVPKIGKQQTEKKHDIPDFLKHAK